MGWPSALRWPAAGVLQNFLASDLALVDIDETPSIQTVLEHPLVKNHASFAYTTASHTPEEPRLRVAFVLSRTIDKAEDYAAILCALTLRLSGDPSATDAARISFGSRGATVFKLGRVIPGAPDG